MTTKEAWLKMINKKNVHQKLGITSNTLYWLRSQAKEHEKFPSQAMMEDHLEKAGFRMVLKTRWISLPDKKTDRTVLSVSLSDSDLKDTLHELHVIIREINHLVGHLEKSRKPTAADRIQKKVIKQSKKKKI